jgi:hypothetical protein
MSKAGQHEHRWYEISRTPDGQVLEACKELGCTDTRKVRVA